MSSGCLNVGMASSIGSRTAKDALFNAFASVGSALSSGRRLEIIDVLAQAPRTVDEISESLNQSVANTSHHLRRLARDGLVTSRKVGRHVLYELASDEVYSLWRAVQEVGAAHRTDLEMRAEAYIGDRSEIDTIDRRTLREWLKSRDGELIVIDVRPEQEYLAGHIEGAISAPPGRLDEVLPLLPETGEVVAYCRGRYCAYADQAVRRLQGEGRTAYRLEDGFREWSQPDV